MTETTITIPGTKYKLPKWAIFAGAGGVLAVLLFKGGKGQAQEQGEFNQEGTSDEEGGLFALFEELLDLYPDPVFEPELEGPQPGGSGSPYDAASYQGEAQFEPVFDVPSPVQEIKKLPYNPAYIYAVYPEINALPDSLEGSPSPAYTPQPAYTPYEIVAGLPVVQQIVTQQVTQEMQASVGTGQQEV